MNKKVIIIAGAALVAVLGGGAGVYFFAPSLLPESIRGKDATADQHKKESAEKKHEPEVGADLDVFVVNLAGTGPSRYLRTTLSLGVPTEHDKEVIKEASGPIRDAVIMYLSQRTYDELLDPTGKAKLRAELHKQVNAAIGKPVVSNVYFKEFLIQ